MATPYPFVPPEADSILIGIGNKTGAQGVFFRGVSEPPVIPEFARKRKVTLHDMAQPGTGQAGNRVIEAVKTGPNRWDWESVHDAVTPAQVALIRGYVEDESDPLDPGYVLLTPDGNATLYLGIMAEDYPMVRNYRRNLRLFHLVTLKVHILGLTVGAVSE